MKKIGLFLGLIVFLIVVFLPYQPISPTANRVLAIALLMLIWWISEAVPMAVTALLPMLLLPLLQVYDMKTASTHYSSPIVYLFMGGFMLALAMEKWNLHKRIALNIVRMTGTRANTIILGFMLSTAFLSMWISNTATAVMMLPIAVSVIDLLEKNQIQSQGKKKFAIAMMLGIAYSANIGGMATLIGTPPNIVMSGFIQEAFNLEVDFATWFAFGFPFSVILLFICYFLLTRVFFPNHLGSFVEAKKIIDQQITNLGKFSKAETITLVVFLFTALAWIFRSQINLILGLSKENHQIVVSDEMIAVFTTVSLFVIPVNWSKSEFILNWDDTQRLPWKILLLFGGGLSLASALEHSGWIKFIGDSFQQSQGDSIIIILGLTTVSLFLTEIMSNVALVTVFLPAVGAMALGLNQNPLLFCIPVTMASSCAFTLPMATPPNAIVFASGHLTIAQMAKAGFWINMVSVFLLMALTKILLPLFFP